MTVDSGRGHTNTGQTTLHGITTTSSIKEGGIPPLNTATGNTHTEGKDGASAWRRQRDHQHKRSAKKVTQHKVMT